MERTPSKVEQELLEQYAKEYVELSFSIKSLELELSRKAGRMTELASKLLPSVMEGVGVQEYKAPTGEDIVLTETIKAVIPGDKEQEAFEWLRSKNLGNLIKFEAKVTTPEQAVVQRVEKYCKRFDIPCATKVSVAWNTLTKHIKEKWSIYEKTAPRDILGITITKEAVLKPQK